MLRASSSACASNWALDWTDHLVSQLEQHVLDLQGDQRLILDHQDAQVGQAGHYNLLRRAKQERPVRLECLLPGPRSVSRIA